MSAWEFAFVFASFALAVYILSHARAKREEQWPTAVIAVYFGVRIWEFVVVVPYQVSGLAAFALIATGLYLFSNLLHDLWSKRKQEALMVNNE